MAYNKLEKLQDNLQAITIALSLEHDGRQATEEERAALRKYSGFGGLKFILNPCDEPSDIEKWSRSDRPYFSLTQVLFATLRENAADEKEYQAYVRSLRNSVLTSFYTPKAVADTISRVLKKQGVVVKNYLEPSAGKGTFIESAKESFPGMKTTAFEKDLITGKVLKALYPNEDIHIDGFETISSAQQGKYDVVSSNIPFGDISVFDNGFATSGNAVKATSTKTIHNYFFLKALEQVREGGFVAFITSRGFMDSPSNDKIREELIRNARLVGAYRLPDGMFRDEAGTDVGSDLVVLQKYTGYDATLDPDSLAFCEVSHGFKAMSGEDWTDITINSHWWKSFMAPDSEAMIGTKMERGTDPYGKPTLVITHEGGIEGVSSLLEEYMSRDLYSDFVDYYRKNEPRPQRAVQQPKPRRVTAARQDQPVQLSLFDLWAEATTPVKEQGPSMEPRPYKGVMLPHYRNGMVVEDSGQLGHLSNVGHDVTFTPIEWNDDQSGRMRLYVKIRDAYEQLYRQEADTRQEQPGLREELNIHYDNFFVKYGYLNEKKNAKLFLMDVQGRDTLTLENSENGQFVKADIFLRPVAFSQDQDIQVMSPSDALSASLNRTGSVDLEYMASISDFTEEELRDSLKDRIYLNSLVDGYEVADKFLAGNVVEKLEKLRQWHGVDEANEQELQRSISALEGVLPTPITYQELDFNFGERWMPKEYFSQFASEFFGTDIKISYAPQMDEFVIDVSGYSAKLHTEFAVTGETKTYDGEDLLRHALYNTVPDIKKCVGYKPNGDPIMGTDHEKVQLAASKIDEIRDAFTSWIDQHPEEWKKELADMYNRKFNCFVRASYDGSHQTFPGLDLKGLSSGKYKINEIYKSQKDCVWMILQNGGGVCDHEVGTGKTLTMCIAAHEMKRLGLAHKPIIIGMKANVAEIAATYQAAFPDDKILYASEKDFTPANRKEFFNRIKNNDYACVIMSHDQFGKIPQSADIQQQVIQEEIDAIEEALDVYERQGHSVSGRMRSGLEKRKINLQNQLLTLNAALARRTDDIVDFKTMGIDHIFIDESHAFKNLAFTTRDSRVAGLGDPKGSERARNLQYAIRTIQDRTGRDLGATFLSGTTISNSLTELYLLFKYLRPQAMSAQDINSFDAWAAVFARKSRDYEFNVAGNVVMKERYRQFIKVPELGAFYNEITDYKTAADVGLERPDMDVQLVNIQPTEDQQDFQQRLLQFAESGDGDLVFRAPLSDSEEKAKMLIVTNLGKKCSLSPKLVNPDYHEGDNTKIGVAARNISDIYYQYNEQKGTQFVFCDLSTPKKGEWSAYQELKDRLVNEYHIPEAEIQFIQDAGTEKKKKEFIDKMNRGNIRVMIGSTTMLGTGVNAQQRAVAVHHLDLPWRPSDMEQRNGRARRKGNEVARDFAGNTVKCFVYAVERSLDSYNFYLLQAKSEFIRQMKQGSLGKRSFDQGGEDADNGMPFAEYVAITSGNTDLLERAKLEKRVLGLESERKAFYKQQQVVQQKLSFTREQIRHYDSVLEKLNADKTSLERALDGVYDDGVNVFDAIRRDNSVFAFHSGDDPQLARYTFDLTQNNPYGDYMQKVARQEVNGEVTVAHLVLEDMDWPLVMSSKTEYNPSTGVNRWVGNKFAVVGGSGLHYTFNNGKVSLSDKNLAANYPFEAISGIPEVIKDQERQRKSYADQLPELERIANKVWEKADQLKELKEQLQTLDRKIQRDMDSKVQQAGQKVEEQPFTIEQKSWGREPWELKFAVKDYPYLNRIDRESVGEQFHGSVRVYDGTVKGKFRHQFGAESAIKELSKLNKEHKDDMEWLKAAVQEAHDSACIPALHRLREMGFDRHGRPLEGVDASHLKVISLGDYKHEEVRALAHGVKENNSVAIEAAVGAMAKALQEMPEAKNVVLVSIPSHKGYGGPVQRLAKELAEKTGIPYVDALNGAEHESLYEWKRNHPGEELPELFFSEDRDNPIPEGKTPVLIDNVIDTGHTAWAAVDALEAQPIMLTIGSTGKEQSSWHDIEIEVNPNGLDYIKSSTPAGVGLTGMTSQELNALLLKAQTQEDTDAKRDLRRVGIDWYTGQPRYLVSHIVDKWNVAFSDDLEPVISELFEKGSSANIFSEDQQKHLSDAEKTAFDSLVSEVSERTKNGYSYQHLDAKRRLVITYEYLKEKADLAVKNAEAVEVKEVKPEAPSKEKYSTITDEEWSHMTTLVSDLQTGNHLLGRPRSDAYRQFFSEVARAHEFVQSWTSDSEWTLTNRQKELLLAESNMYYEGLSGLASFLEMDVQELRNALDAVPVNEVNHEVISDQEENNNIDIRFKAAFAAALPDDPERLKPSLVDDFREVLHRAWYDNDLDARAAISKDYGLDWRYGVTNHTVETAEEDFEGISDEAYLMTANNVVNQRIRDLFDYQERNKIKDPQFELLKSYFERAPKEIEAKNVEFCREFLLYTHILVNQYAFKPKEEIERIISQNEDAKTAESPIMKQFHDLKAKHPDALLLFRVGDFYETYEQDAVEASRILGIALTHRHPTVPYNSPSNAMAGFPFHALDTYLPKLVRAGKRVAICDQLEVPKEKVKRGGITELVTPGIRTQLVETMSDVRNILPHQTMLRDALIQRMREAGVKVNTNTSVAERLLFEEDAIFHSYNIASISDISETNNNFNEELQRQIDGSLEVGHIYKLGFPGEILQAAGFPDDPIELSSTHLSEKTRQDNHIFELNDVKNLVTSLNNPVAVFVYGAKSRAQNVIIEQEREGKKFLIGVHFNQEYRGIKVSDIRGIFNKDNAEWLHWIEQGKLLWVDKEKIQNLIAEQRINLAEVDYLDLDFVAKVIEKFENPKLFDGKLREHRDFSLKNPVFVSNAQRAVERISQERATPDQWLHMIEKNGGIKAGEDRWTGLSDWLKNSQERILTKQQVLEYIAENQIQIEEVHYQAPTAQYHSPKLDMMNEEFQELMGEGEEATGSIYIDDHARWAFEKMFERYGDDFRNATEYVRDDEQGWHIKPSENYDGEGPDSRSAEYYGLERGINSTRLDYTTRGLDNKREIALTVPTVERWNAADYTHFGDAGDGRAVAWVRFGETIGQHEMGEEDIQRRIQAMPSADKWQEVTYYNLVPGYRNYFNLNRGSLSHADCILEKDGVFHIQFDGYSPTVKMNGEKNLAALKRVGETFTSLQDAVAAYNEFIARRDRVIDEKVLVIDEIQSKRHQEGREKGYYSPADIRDMRKELRNLESNQDSLFYDLPDEIKESRRNKIQYLNSAAAPEGMRERYYEIEKRRNDLIKQIDSAMTGKLIPAAPFEKNWHELAMKRMLRYAAENGYDRVAWTTGNQQADRYDLGEHIDFVTAEPYEAQSPGEVSGFDVTLQTRGMASVDLFVTSDGIIQSGGYGEDANYFAGQPLYKVVGKGLSDKILAVQEWERFDGEDLRVGADGMKGFYDGMLVNFMDKYGKQWGVRTEDVELNRLYVEGKMHSVAIVPQMREDIRKGQPMFFRAGDRQAFGFVYDDEIYVDRNIATEETPLHEYTHLWAEVMRQQNPKEWENIVSLMKGNHELWQDVTERYSHLTDENDIAEEVLAHYSGKRGFERMEEEYRNHPGLDKENINSILDTLSDVLSRLWSFVADFLHIHYTSKEQVADQILRDALNGVNPLDYRLADAEKVSNQIIRPHFIGEKGARNIGLSRGDGFMFMTRLLESAKDYEQQGYDALRIKQITGWERGADGKWRSELSGIRVKSMDVGVNTVLSDIVDAPDLFKAYPELKDVRVEIGGIFDNGQYNHETNTITLNEIYRSSEVTKEQYEEVLAVNEQSIIDAESALQAGKDVEFNKGLLDELHQLKESVGEQASSARSIDEIWPDINSVIAHEVQHVIQHIEGFAVGGNLRTVANMRLESAQAEMDKYQAVYDEYKLLEDKSYYTDDASEAMYYIREMDKYEAEHGDELKAYLSARASKDAAEMDIVAGVLSDKNFDEYRRLVGEVEARNVSRRAEMSVMERRNSLAASTEDVERDRQIISFGGLGIASQATKKVVEHPRSPRLSPQDREAGGALVDQLESMGIPVHTDNRENRRVLKAAEYDHSEIGKIRHLKTEHGESYGFAYKGEIHLDMRKVDAELPLHEYAHLWVEAMRRVNPENWTSVVNIIKSDAASWNHVKQLYPELDDDDDLAEEVIARYSGKRGAGKLRAELQRMTPRDENYHSRWNNIYKNISKSIQDFWKHTGDSLNVEYKNADDVADMIMKDFAEKVSPVKKMEKWLESRDNEYAAAVQEATMKGDWSKAHTIFVSALEENVGNGITPFMAVDGYRGKLDRLARAVKDGNNITALQEAVDLMAPRIPANAVLVPVPSHLGYATDTLTLAKALGERTDVPVVDILKSAPRERQYDVKKTTGHPLTAGQLGIYMEGELPKGKMPFVIDNVVNSGNTAEACVKALGYGIVYSLASAVSQERHAATLKSAMTAVYDKEGRLVPLSERFDLKNKWLGRVMNYKPDKHNNVIAGLENYSEQEIEKYVREHFETVLEGSDIDAEIVAVKVIGSRVNGNSDNDSDLDVLLEFRGDISEDSLFNILNDEEEGRLYIEGIPVDINPITEGKSGTIEEFLERNKDYVKPVVVSNQNISVMEENDKLQATIKDVTSRDEKFRYQLLDRLKQDCNYFLGYGNRNEGSLWAGNAKDHVAVMQALWDSLPEKPEWLTKEQLADYASKMLEPVKDLQEKVAAVKTEVQVLTDTYGLVYTPIVLPQRVFAVDADDPSREVSYGNAAVKGFDVMLYDDIVDSYDDNNGVSLSELPQDKQLNVLEQLREKLSDESRNLSVYVNTEQVPEYALSAIVNGDFSGIEDEDDRKDIEEFLDRYAGMEFSVREDQASFTNNPAFGKATDCVPVDIIEITTTAALRMKQIHKMDNEQKATKNESAENQAHTYSAEESTVIKEAIGEHLQKVSNDYYSQGVKSDVDVLQVVRDSEISNERQASQVAREVALEILQNGEAHEPGILSRYGIEDMEAEADEMSLEATNYAKTVLYNKQNGVEQQLEEKVAALNERVKEFNEVSKAADPNYGIFNKPVQFYLIEKLDDDHFALISHDEETGKYATSWISAKDLDAKIEDLSVDMGVKIIQLRETTTFRQIKDVERDPELREATGYMNDVISEALPDDGDKITIRPFTIYNGDDAYTITSLYHEKVGDEHHFLANSQAGDISIDLDNIINNVSSANEVVAAVRESQISQLLGGRGGIDFIQRYGSPYKVVNDATFGELAYIKEISTRNGKVTIDGAIDNDGAPVYVKELKDLRLDGIDNLFAEVREVVNWKPSLNLTMDQALMVADHHGLHSEVEIDLMGGMEPELALQKRHIMPTVEKLAEIESLNDPDQVPVVDAVPMLLEKVIPNDGDELVLDYGGAHLDFQYIGFGYQQLEDVKSIKHIGDGYVASNGEQSVDVSRLASGPDGEYFLKVIKDNVKQMEAEAMSEEKKQEEVAQQQEVEKRDGTENLMTKQYPQLKNLTIMEEAQQESNPIEIRFQHGRTGVLLPSTDPVKNAIIESMKNMFIFHNRGRNSVDDFITERKKDNYEIKVWNNVNDHLWEITNVDNNTNKVLQIQVSGSRIAVSEFERRYYGMDNTTETIGNYDINIKNNHLEDKVMSEEKKQEEVQAQQQEQQPEQKKRGWNIDYTKYAMPEGVSVEKAQVFKLDRGENAGKYAVSAVIDGQRKTQVLYKNDVDAYFSKDEQGSRKATAEQLVAKYFGQKKEDQVAEVKQEVEAEQKQGQAASVQNEQAGEKKKGWNIDYTKYAMPEGAVVTNAFVKKDEQSGKYKLMATINGEFRSADLYPNDRQAFFEKNEQGERKATVDQLVAKYFSKSTAEKMGKSAAEIDSVGELENAAAEAQETVAEEKAAEKQEEQERQAQEAEEKKEAEQKKDGKEEVSSGLALQTALLVGALHAANEHDGVWMNEAGKQAPLFWPKENKPSAFNGLMMALHSDANDYKTNMYTTFAIAKSEGISVRGKEKGLPYNWDDWSKFENKYNKNDVIDREKYLTLDPQEKDLYRVQFRKEMRPIFNIDQTTLPMAKKEQYNFLVQVEDKEAAKDNLQAVKAEQVAEVKAKHPDSLMLFREDGNYVMYGEDAKKAAAVLHMSIVKPNGEDIKTENISLSFPKEELDTHLPRLIRDGNRIAICDDVESSKLQRLTTSEEVYAASERLVASIGEAGGVINKDMAFTQYDGEKDILNLGRRMSAVPGQEMTQAMEHASEVYRAAVAYTGTADRLNRGSRLELPADRDKYERLVQELSVGVMMTRMGLPATISKENRELIPYWERELKEDPKLLDAVERDVNKTIQVLDKISAGEKVDYAVLRGERPMQTAKPRMYTIASELATIPNIEHKQVVVVRDQQSKSAAVILPAGASLEMNNEVPGMNKNRFVIALRNEGIEDVRFYNAGGALGLNQPNEFFAGKEVDVAHLKQYTLVRDETVDLSQELARTNKVDIEKVSAIKNDQNEWVFYVKPVEGEAITIKPEASDLSKFFSAYQTPQFDAVREELAQKYYGLAQQHPEYKQDFLMPKVENIDLERIKQVHIQKDKFDENKIYVTCLVDDQHVNTRIDRDSPEWQRFWLVDDKTGYKVNLAAKLFEAELNKGQEKTVVQSQEEVVTETEEVVVDNGQEEVDEEQQSRGRTFHR